VSRRRQLAALAEQAESALAEEAGAVAGSGVVGATRAAVEHRWALTPGDPATAHRLVEYLPTGPVLRDTLAEAARDPEARFAAVPDPLLATILKPGSATARYEALDQLGPLRFGAEVSLRLRVYRDNADAEGLVRLRETVRQTWQGSPSPDDLPFAVRQGVAYRVTGRIAPWLAELDRGLAQLHASEAALALAMAIGDPVRAAKLLEDGRQRLEALLRSGSRERYDGALEAACELIEPLRVLRRLAPDDVRLEQTEARLESLLDNAQPSTSGQAGELAAALVAYRAEAGRIGAAEQFLHSRLLLPSARRLANAALFAARLRREPSALPELVASLPVDDRDQLLLLALPEAAAVPATSRWSAADTIADPDLRAVARLAMVERLMEQGQHEAAAEVWEGWYGVDVEELSELTRARVTVLAWRVLGQTSPPDPLSAGGEGESTLGAPLLDQAHAVLDYASGTSGQRPASPGARCLALTARGDLHTALRDGVLAPGPIFGFPPPLVSWSRAARQVEPDRWGRLAAAAWSAALASPERPLVVEPLAKLPAERLADWVERLLTARAESYRQALLAALGNAIAEVGQGTEGRPRSRPR